MNKNKIALIALLAIAVISSVYFIFIKTDIKASSYTYAEIKRSNLDLMITSSGTIEATSTVDVGTQVSGIITKLYADFNSEVKKGQLLAVIDTVNLAAQVRDARANLAKSKADYKQKTAIHATNIKLFEKKFISDLDFIKSESDAESSLASLQSAEQALQRAKTNLSYAYIYAPISGRVINRAIEIGQTVAASFSAPTLFTIAQDLSSMRILASVDESDIGQIKEGQSVKFTVQSYSDKTFEGRVTQIRLKSNTLSNVVNYTVVISAGNSERLLLPGMTATVDFYVTHKENILLIPNTALRVEATDDMMKEMMTNMPRPGGPPPNDMKKPPLANGSMKKVFYTDASGKLKMSMVTTGLTDGKNTEIVDAGQLEEGMKVISGIQETGTATTKKSTNALTPSSQQNGPPGPPMM